MKRIKSAFFFFFSFHFICNNTNFCEYQKFTGKSKPEVQGMSASELIKMKKKQEAEIQARQNQRKAATQSKEPRLGRDDFAFFSENSQPKKSVPSRVGSKSAEIAKRKAMAMLKSKGPLTKQDPNRVGGGKEFCEKKRDAVRKRVEQDLKERNGGK